MSSGCGDSYSLTACSRDGRGADADHLREVALHVAVDRDLELVGAGERRDRHAARVAVLRRDALRGRDGAGRVVGQVHRAREGGGVGRLLHVWRRSSFQCEKSTAQPAKPRSTTSVIATQTATTPRSSPRFGSGWRRRITTARRARHRLEPEDRVVGERDAGAEQLRHELVLELHVHADLVVRLRADLVRRRRSSRRRRRGRTASNRRCRCT